MPLWATSMRRWPQSTGSISRMSGYGPSSTTFAIGCTERRCSVVKKSVEPPHPLYRAQTAGALRYLRQVEQFIKGEILELDVPFFNRRDANEIVHGLVLLLTLRNSDAEANK